MRALPRRCHGGGVMPGADMDLEQFMNTNGSRSRGADLTQLGQNTQPAWNAIADAVSKGESEEAEQRLADFQRRAKWSPDLVPDDAERLVEKARARMPSIQRSNTIAMDRRRSFPVVGGVEPLQRRIGAAGA